MSGLHVQIRAKRYASPPALVLEDVDFEVEPAQFVAVVGPSGAGKSTLLSIVAGLDDDWDGSVERATGDDRLAFVFQTPRLMPWLSVRDNVGLVLGEDPQRLASVDPLLEEMGLAGYENAYPAQLSGGMQRRVALARAFAVEPTLLLMDEPFVSLDEPLAWRLRGMLLEHWQRLRPTVLYVTHDLREALALADRVLFFTTRPARVLLDHHVDLPRPRDPADRALTDYQHHLMSTHPDLLSGRLEHEPESRPQTAGAAGDDRSSAA